MTEHGLGGSLLLEETLLRGCLFYSPYNCALSRQAWAPDLGDVGHQHFVKFNVKGRSHLFLEAQFTHVIKTHTSAHGAPASAGNVFWCACPPLEEEAGESGEVKGKHPKKEIKRLLRGRRRCPCLCS